MGSPTELTDEDRAIVRELARSIYDSVDGDISDDVIWVIVDFAQKHSMAPEVLVLMMAQMILGPQDTPSCA